MPRERHLAFGSPGRRTGGWRGAPPRLPLPGLQLLGRVITVTVALSILLHGMSAVVLAKRYGAWHIKAAERRPHLPEGGEAGHSSTTR
ncbi:hypothetical protein [Streptomyces finlayi]|uniref:hypothetical protein n=1 Tax=Streptomyces finlayi TaxID=67296 RepID=UPI0016258AEF|nr:hypothetical protein [Streptomyces finlayi]